MSLGYRCPICHQNIETCGHKRALTWKVQYIAPFLKPALDALHNEGVINVEYDNENIERYKLPVALRLPSDK